MEEITQFAPVLIPTLCRFEHFKRCVESLAKCAHAEKTELYIALDFPLKDLHWEGYEKIVEYVDTIEGFISVNVIKREKNFGVSLNIKEGRKFVFEKFDRLIFSEDDNEFSPNFLEYINKGLDKYEDDPKVFAICGYNYPVEMPNNFNSEAYLWKGFSAWGYGTWRNKFSKVSFSVAEVKDFLRKPSNISQLNKYADHYLPALLNIINTKYMTGDTAICMMLIKNNMYCVFPSISKVRNHGNDGSGVHCGISNIYINQVIDDDRCFKYDNTIEEENREVYKVLKYHFSVGFMRKIIIIVKYFLFYMNINLKNY